MLRTTTREAVNNIRSYIMNGYDPENYDLPRANDFGEASKQILSCFWHEFGKYEAKRGRNYQESFVEWCAGLPTIIDTCYFYNRSAVDDLGAILEETEAEKAKYTEAQAERTLSCLIYRELTKALQKKYNCFVWNVEEF